MESKEKEENQVSERGKYRKKKENGRKSLYICVFTCMSPGDYGKQQGQGNQERHGQAKRTRNHQKRSETVQKSPKIMKILKIGSERSPRDKSGAFGFENMFWPLGNVARPEGVTGGVQGWGPGCVCAYGVVGLVCVLCTYASRSLHVHMSRPYHLFISIAPTNRNANRSQVKGIQGHQQAKSSQKCLKILKMT